MSGHNASRIALYYHCPFRGDGVAKTFLALAGAFVERGYTVDCLCVQTDGPHRDALPDGVALVPLSPGNILARIASMVRYLRRSRPAALISGMDFANICGLARAIARVDTRIIADVQVTYSYYLNMRGGLIRLVGPYLIRWLLSKADAIVAVSDGVADDLARFLPARVRIATIHNPVETAQLENLAREPVDHPWFAAKAPPVVLGVGRLEAQKDFVSLIRAFRRVRDTAEARLIILGEGSQRPALEALIQELGLHRDVEMPGFVPNPYKYMARSSCSRRSPKASATWWSKPWRSARRSSRRTARPARARSSKTALTDASCRSAMSWRWPRRSMRRCRIASRPLRSRNARRTSPSTASPSASCRSLAPRRASPPRPPRTIGTPPQRSGRRQDLSVRSVRASFPASFKSAAVPSAGAPK